MNKEKQEVVKKPCPLLREVGDQEENFIGFFCMAGGDVQDIVKHSTDVSCARRCFYDQIPR